MFQNNSNLRVNYNDIFTNDLFIQEINRQNLDYNFFSYSNMKSLNQNDYKIEE